MAAALTIAAGCSALFAQAPATCKVDAPVDSSVRAATAALMENGFFIVDTDVVSGFVKAKRYTSNDNLLSAKIGFRTEIAVIVTSAGNGDCNLSIQLYEQTVDTQPAFREEGLVEDRELCQALTTAIKENLTQKTDTEDGTDN